MRAATIRDLFVEKLQELYYIEHHILAALPVLESAATSEELRQVLRDHHEQTERQAERLELLLDRYELGRTEKKSKGIDGIINEGETFLKSGTEGMLLDLGIVASAKEVEHYEMGEYENAIMMADRLDEADAVALLHEILQEEQEANDRLDMVAESIVTPEQVPEFSTP